MQFNYLHQASLAAGSLPVPRRLKTCHNSTDSSYKAAEAAKHARYVGIHNVPSACLLQHGSCTLFRLSVQKPCNIRPYQLLSNLHNAHRPGCCACPSQHVHSTYTALYNHYMRQGVKTQQRSASIACFNYLQCLQRQHAADAYAQLLAHCTISCWQDHIIYKTPLLVYTPAVVTDSCWHDLAGLLSTAAATCNYVVGIGSCTLTCMVLS
eukprot:GHRR01012943.1.p1 GENE.GHRR01012943.1~~GHRR01012943.1.p1  ORF type:complete len:209 (-),score=52.00 GHRR01012943.1:1627-2253(-)